MGSEWVQLRDIVSIKGGKRLPKGESLQVDPNSHPYIRVRDMGSKYIPREGLEFVPDTVFPKIKNYIVNENDVIISIVGTVGLVAVIDSFFDSASQTENCAKLSGLDALDAQYLYYCLVSPLGQREIAVQTVGAVQPKLPLYGIENITIPWPLRSIRESIVGCLGGLDNKIALNRQINTTLESMAQALFKSWFVDFDPVIDNALAAGNEIPDELAARAARREALRQQTNKTTNKTTGATGAVSVEQAAPETGLSDQRLPPEIQQLFPDRFVLTEEMGWVPEGWEVGVLEDLLVLQRGFDLPKSSRTDGVYPLMAASGQDGTHNESKVPGPGITTGRSGKLGEVCFVERDFWPLNTTLWVKEFRRSSPYHAFYLLKSMDLEKYNSGSAVPTLNRNYVHNVSALLPSKNVIAAYDKFVSGCYSKKYANDEQIESLANLRDSLLPKLLSGQITIPDAEQQLAGVL